MAQKKASLLPLLKKTLVKAKQDDVLEVVGLKPPPMPLYWLAQYRRTRQLVAYAVSDRSEATCTSLWAHIPRRYKRCVLYTDFRRACAEVLPAAQHRAGGKGAGQTCYIERFNNVLRQWLGRFVRRTLSFSEKDAMHESCLLLLLHDYNTRTQHTLKHTMSHYPEAVVYPK